MSLTQKCETVLMLIVFLISLSDRSRRRLHDACIVHQDVHLTQVLAGLDGCFPDSLGAGYIAHVGTGLAT